MAISIVGAALILALSWVASASAGLLDDPVRAATDPVQTATSSLPEVTAPASQQQQPVTTPQVHVEVPSPPPPREPAPVKVSPPPAPKVSVDAPSGGSSSATDTVSRTAGAVSRSVGEVTGHVGSAGEAAGDAKGATDTVTGTLGDHGRAAAGAAGSGVGGGSGGSVNGPRAIVAGANAGPGAGPVDPAREAPVRRWLAKVWPAIALGPFTELIRQLQSQAGLEGATPVVTAGIFALLSETVADAFSSGAVGAPERFATSSPTPVAHREISLPVGGEISIIALLIASTVLIALLVVAVRQELGPTFRWPE